MSCVSGSVDKIEGDFEAGGDSRSDSDFTHGWISEIFEFVLLLILRQVPKEQKDF